MELHYPADLMHNLGVVLDFQLLLIEKVAAMARKAFAHLWVAYLNWKVPLSVTHAFINSRLDYCNIPYMGLSLKTIWKRQLVQNAAMQVANGATYSIWHI